VLSGGRAIAGWKPGEGKRWVAKLLAGKDGPWRFTQLFVDGKRQTRARLPDTEEWRRWWRVAPGPDPRTAFRFPEKALKDWPNALDVEVNLIPQYSGGSRPPRPWRGWRWHRCRRPGGQTGPQTSVRVI
jgi:hypothetical protein